MGWDFSVKFDVSPCLIEKQNLTIFILETKDWNLYKFSAKNCKLEESNCTNKNLTDINQN